MGLLDLVCFDLVLFSLPPMRKFCKLHKVIHVPYPTKPLSALGNGSVRNQKSETVSDLPWVAQLVRVIVGSQTPFCLMAWPTVSPRSGSSSQGSQIMQELCWGPERLGTKHGEAEPS